MLFNLHDSFSPILSAAVPAVLNGYGANKVKIFYTVSEPSHVQILYKVSRYNASVISFFDCIIILRVVEK